jgi:transposase
MRSVSISVTVGVKVARFDLTDFEWSVIQPLLPNKPRGVSRVDDRRVLNGIARTANC